MSFGTQDADDEVMNEINMTPLVDVMLVLLIIFIITIPVMNHAVNIQLPQASSQQEDKKPETIQLGVAEDGSFFWNQSKIDDNLLMARLVEASQKTPQPELHLRGDKNVRYERIAIAMSSAQQAGIKKIGFVTEP